MTPSLITAAIYKPEVIFAIHEDISVAVDHWLAKSDGQPMIALHTTWSAYSTRAWDFQCLYPRVRSGPRRHRTDEPKRRRPRIDWITHGPGTGHQVRGLRNGMIRPIPCRRAGFLHSRYRIATTSDGADLYQLRCRISRKIPTSPLEVPTSCRMPRQRRCSKPEALRKAAEMLVNAQPRSSSRQRWDAIRKPYPL